MLRGFFLSLFFLAGLTACDLRPAYDSAATEALAQIEVPPMADRKGQIARLALQQALDPRHADLPKLYELQASVTTATRLVLGEGTALQLSLIHI